MQIAAIELKFVCHYGYFIYLFKITKNRLNLSGNGKFKLFPSE